MDEKSEPAAQQWNTDYPGGTAQTPTGDEWNAAGTDPGLAPARTPRMAPALVAGVVAAVVAATIWYFVVALSGWQIGFLAVGVGFLVGWAMKRAAGGVGGIRLQVAAVVLTLLSMVAAEYFVGRHFLGEFFVSQGDSAALPLFFPVSDMVSMVTEIVKAEPITLLFWVIALSGAWRVTQETPEQQHAAAAETDPLQP